MIMVEVVEITHVTDPGHIPCLAYLSMCQMLLPQLFSTNSKTKTDDPAELVAAIIPRFLVYYHYEKYERA